MKEEKKLEANLVQAIIEGQERERRRLAREIHDGIAPLLSSAKFELDLFLEELREHGKDISDERLMNIRSTIDTISTDLRNLSHRLMPRLLEKFGLLSAIQNLVTRAGSTTKAKVDLICNLNPQERFEREIELNLFRCCQELLTNAVKHASASRITVQVIRHESSIVLMVEDDGKGFNPEELNQESEGIGLLNIETRARTLNGEFLIESITGKGTLISIELPV
jgi:signal transduction histidine kinase